MFSTSGPGTPCHKADVDTLTLIQRSSFPPKTAFQARLVPFVPFLVIDRSWYTHGKGMLMLPLVMIPLPFKILFVLVDGWYLVVRSLLASFM